MKKILDIDRRIKGKPIDLVEEPVIIRVRDFNEESAEKFSLEMNKAHNTGQPVIPIIVDSFGGMVYSLISMMADIDNAKIPVATIAIGKAMSCGCVLLTCGAEGYRFMDANATVMMHDVSSWECGKIEEMKAGIKQSEKLHKKIFQRMAINCGHASDYFLKIMDQKKHAEWFFDAKEAKKHNIVNHVRVPEFKTKLSVEITFE